MIELATLAGLALFSVAAAAAVTIDVIILRCSRKS